MKSVSPWFQTANLLNGIRKTISKIEANRSHASGFEGRSLSAGQPQSVAKDKSDHHAA